MDLVEQCALVTCAAAGLALDGGADGGGVQVAGELKALDFGSDFAEFTMAITSRVSLKVTRSLHWERDD